MEARLNCWKLAKGYVNSTLAVNDIALVSLLHAFSEAAGKHGDVEAMINHALYCAFKEAESLHDDAIAWVVEAAEEDRAVAMRPRAVKKSA